MHTVISSSTAISRRRALVASVVGLGVPTALAAVLVDARRTPSLGDRVAPVGWPIAFRVPVGWIETARDDDLIQFLNSRDASNPKRVVVSFLAKPPTASAGEVARQVMTLYLSRFPGAGPPTPAEEEALGPLPGACVNMPDTGDYVHVGTLPRDDALVVILRYHTARPFSALDAELCRKITDSVDLVERP